MTTRVMESSWELALPDRWEWQRDDECVTLYDPEGVGALQVSAATKNSVVTDEDLRGFASEHIEAGAKIRELACGDFSGFMLAFGTTDAYWRHWYLSEGREMLFVTYNCSPNDRGIEDQPIAEILGSLRLRAE